MIAIDPLEAPRIWPTLRRSELYAHGRTLNKIIDNAGEVTEGLPPGSRSLHLAHPDPGDAGRSRSGDSIIGAYYYLKLG
jgi:hypothetical protein